MKIVIDTNMLMTIVQFKVDLFGELRNLGYNEFFILSGTLDELAKIRESKPVVKIVEQSVRSGKLKVVQSSGPVDRDIVELGMAVATNDKEIIENAKERGLRVVRLRQRKYLVEE